MSTKRFSFRKDIKYDLALLTEVETLNPFVAKAPKKVWCEIAENLLKSDLKMAVSDRSCRERLELLLKEFSKEETLSIKASGVEENDMEELKRLLTSVLKLRDEKPSLSMRKMYSKANRQEAEKTREAALINLECESDSESTELGSDATNNNTNSNTDNTENEQIDTTGSEALSVESRNKGTPACEPPAKKSKKNELIVYLESKNEKEFQIRQEELKIRAAEAENKKMKIQVSQQKLSDDAADRQRNFVLAKQKQEAELQERQQMSQLLMKLLEKKAI